MKTIFDYDVTPEEQERILGGVQEAETYRKGLSGDVANLHLAYLFDGRGDKGKAAHFANKLPPMERQDFYRTLSHNPVQS